MKIIPIPFLAVFLGLTLSTWAAVPVLDDPVPAEGQPVRVNPVIPIGKTLLFPITASDADGHALVYKVSSSNPNILVRTKTGNPVWRMSVSHEDNGVADPAYTGTMDFMVFRDWLPITSNYVLGMTQAGFYDNVVFHRLADLGGGQGTTGFIFQGGDPLGTGGGGPGMVGNDPQTAWKFQNEFFEGTIFSGRGQLAMANAGTQTGYSLGGGGTLNVPDYLDTNGSQFFITDGQPRHLDFKHNIFGQMLRGWEVLSLLKTTKTTSSRPDKDVKITAASVITNETDAVLVLSAKAAGKATITVTVTDPTGAKATKTFVVTAAEDASNCNPFFHRVKPRVTPKDIPSVFALEPVDLEFDYLDIAHSLLPLSASVGPKGTLLAQSGKVIQVQPNAGYAGLISLGLSIRQFSIGGGGFEQITDYTNAYIAAGDREAQGEGVTIEAQAGVTLTNVKTALLRDLDTAGQPGNFTAKINWGDGTPLSTATLVRDTTPPASSFYAATGGHVYPRTGIYPVVVDFIGDNGARATAFSTAVVTTAGSPLQAFGEDFQLSGAKVADRIVATFTDASPLESEGYQASIDWGDGLGSSGVISRHPVSGDFFVRGTHTYQDSERYSVRVRVHKTGNLPAADVFAWTTIEPIFSATPHLPPFPHAKLTIAWNSGPTKSQQGTPGLDYQVKYSGVFVIINSGNRNLGNSKMRFWLSDDRVLQKTGLGADTPVPVNKKAQLEIVAFPAGSGGSGQFTIQMPKGESAARKFLIAEAIYRDPVADGDGTDKLIATGPLAPSVLVTPRSGYNAPSAIYRTTEAGGTASFNVVLDSAPINTAAAGQPRNDKVTIPLESVPATGTGTSFGTVSPAQLEFTADNWFLPQTVTVTGLRGTVGDHNGNKSYKILLKAAVSGDAIYNGFVGPEVPMLNLDVDP